LHPLRALCWCFVVVLLLLCFVIDHFVVVYVCACD
jgi:hypothetical protein